MITTTTQNMNLDMYLIHDTFIPAGMSHYISSRLLSYLRSCGVFTVHYMLGHLERAGWVTGYRWKALHD